MQPALRTPRIWRDSPPPAAPWTLPPYPLCSLAAHLRPMKAAGMTTGPHLSPQRLSAHSLRNERRRTTHLQAAAHRSAVCVLSLLRTYPCWHSTVAHARSPYRRSVRIESNSMKISGVRPDFLPVFRTKWARIAAEDRFLSFRAARMKFSLFVYVLCLVTICYLHYRAFGEREAPSFPNTNSLRPKAPEEERKANLERAPAKEAMSPAPISFTPTPVNNSTMELEAIAPSPTPKVWNWPSNETCVLPGFGTMETNRRDAVALVTCRVRLSLHRVSHSVQQAGIRQVHAVCGLWEEGHSLSAGDRVR